MYVICVYVNAHLLGTYDIPQVQHQVLDTRFAFKVLQPTVFNLLSMSQGESKVNNRNVISSI